ncbi:MAG: hypothetical protein M1514_03140 [Patescibacteria group bacterium]|nr:hypothetical protein [Patescibacteria group bacterium]
MIKKILLCLLFFVISPTVLFLTIYFINLGSGRVLGEATEATPVPLVNVMASETEESVGLIAPTIKAENSIPPLIENYLRHYNSPLLPFVEQVVQSAKRYNVDPRLIVAIAQQESNLGKVIPENCFNAWGWAIHERGTKCFQSWPEAIEIVTQGIAQGYCQKGLCDDPCLMMKKYTPKSNGSWCAGVKQFLNEMETGRF